MKMSVEIQPESLGSPTFGRPKNIFQKKNIRFIDSNKKPTWDTIDWQVRIRHLSEDRFCKVEEEGEIEILSPTRMLNYFHENRLESCLHPKPYCTNITICENISIYFRRFSICLSFSLMISKC